jgi:tetratricopeptide (TPR) repeat protein
MGPNFMAGSLSPGIPEIRKPRPRGLAGALVAVLVIVFCVMVAHTTDPARSATGLHPKDDRWRHIGSLSFAEGEQMVHKLRRQRDGERDPERRALLATQLSDALVRRGKHRLALSELEEALRQHPNQPALRVREALLYFALGQRERAADTLAAARRLGGDAEVVERAAAIIEGRLPAEP